MKFVHNVNNSGGERMGKRSPFTRNEGETVWPNGPSFRNNLYEKEPVMLNPVLINTKKDLEEIKVSKRLFWMDDQGQKFFSRLDPVTGKCIGAIMMEIIPLQ